MGRGRPTARVKERDLRLVTATSPAQSYRASATVVKHVLTRLSAGLYPLLTGSGSVGQHIGQAIQQTAWNFHDNRSVQATAKRGCGSGAGGVGGFPAVGRRACGD